MHIYEIHGKISPLFRRKRMQDFLRRFQPDAGTRILDIGGYPQFWREANLLSHITILNVHPVELPADMPGRCETVVGDGTQLSYGDGEFDIVFSNSVIEHLGTWENQQKFAREARRVGRRYSVQTPAREFFVEPHFMAPLIHWLPRSLQRPMARWGTPWGWMTQPNATQIEDFLNEIRLLTAEEFKQLFPDGQLLREKTLGLTKSYTAVS